MTAFRKHAFALIFGVCLAVECAPLAVTRVLPFQDAAGITGLGGVFAHQEDPGARIADFYDIDKGAYPSSLYFAWTFVAAKCSVPSDIATNLFVALFCLAGPPLALLFLLSAFGRSRWLALLAFAVGYHHQIWFGFLGSAAAVTGILFSLAFARRLLDRFAWGTLAGLGVSLLFVAAAHPFSLALALVLVAPFFVWPRSTGDESHLVEVGRRLLALLPLAAFVGPWAARFFRSDAPGDQTSVVTSIARQFDFPRAPLTDDLVTFFSWLGNGYQSGWDEWVPGIGVVTVVVLLFIGFRAAPPVMTGRERTRDAALLGFALGALALGFLFLPSKVYWPTYWWGVRFRCVVPLFLVAIVAIRPRSHGLPVMALVPAVAVSMAFALFVLADFRGPWRGKTLDGFDQALAAIPPGQSVLGLSTRDDDKYTLPHPYLVQHYVVRRGGRAVPYLGGHKNAYWVTLQNAPLAPTWGDARAFDFHTHALGFDYFLVEGATSDPLRNAPPGAVALVSDAGRWRVYKRLPMTALPLPDREFR